MLLSGVISFLCGLQFFLSFYLKVEGLCINFSLSILSQKGGVIFMSKKVMIVEDNELNMKLFRDLVEASGYETVETRNGLMALELARSSMPSLILVDIQLPEVSGIDVIKQLKEDEKLRSIPIVAVTAFAMKGDEERIRASGCEEYMSKPISVPHFITMVKHFLD
ncbi:polar-differentiation response regulator divK [Cardidatus Bartonella washoeensis 085-0475]|uniref:Polar-differentiation response regulator divK n=2 Tax=Candidatus Bartonella washoeensis TaxID=186739 RepID=J1JNY7_9HYPH|nr:polar-differentiation response regulator divK [Bartonella washoeensis 085-0475]